jgi:glutathione S-transferase
MAEHKGIDHQMIWLLPGLHPALIRSRGFRHGTVPAMKGAGKRLQNSREISRALEDMTPEPRLFPEDPAKRLAVEEAERWGEEILQGVPRRVYRWVASNDGAFRRQLAGEVGMPVPGLAAKLNAPVARYMAGRSGSSDDRVRATLGLLPALLDHVAKLLREGTIGGREPNAADFQIVTSVRSLLCHEDLAPLIANRRAGKWAMELMPEYPGVVPAALPPEWLEPLRG